MSHDATRAFPSCGTGVTDQHSTRSYSRWLSTAYGAQPVSVLKLDVEAFNIGQYLWTRGLKIDGFRKSRGSSYINSEGVVLRYRYFRGGWYLDANR